MVTDVRTGFASGGVSGGGSEKETSEMNRVTCVLIAFAVLLPASGDWKVSGQSQAPRLEYRVLATTKNSTMQKELSDAAEAGFRFQAFMGGETAFGGHEVVAVAIRSGAEKRRFAYSFLATTKTSTMQKELQDAADMGFEYRGAVP
jgi:hypothetical protein